MNSIEHPGPARQAGRFSARRGPRRATAATAFATAPCWMLVDNVDVRSSALWAESRGETWQQVNDWIRTSGAFDGVIDFAAATAAADDPLPLAPAYDSGDGLHPDDTGTQAMADSIDLSLLSG